MAHSKKSLVGVGMVLLFLLGLLSLWRRSLAAPSTSVISQTITDTFARAGYSPEMASYWIAIAKFETANFNSVLCVKYHNLFGMSYPTVGRDYGKVTLTDDGKPHDFSTYDNYQQSVDDLIEYLDAFGYSKDYNTIDELISYMKQKNYFGSSVSLYLQGVKQYL